MWTEFKEPQFLTYWVIKRISDFRIREYCMKNVIRTYQMPHSVFFKDGMPISEGFTEIYVIQTVCYKNRITFSSRDLQNMHSECYLRNALKMGLTKCTFITDTQM